MARTTQGGRVIDIKTIKYEALKDIQKELDYKNKRQKKKTNKEKTTNEDTFCKHI